MKPRFYLCSRLGRQLSYPLVCLLLGLMGLPSALADERRQPGFDSVVAPFFKARCVKCHGPEKSKVQGTLLDLVASLSEGRDMAFENNE